ncbi:MAG: TonB-dependent receptor [Candidatus Symbiothrix sp.]|jgi:TonB-linked SusC/RagA family outer membrane protein|nr:TonB-dependent receptor [Candidatus Symbiothrix sp.]
MNVLKKLSNFSSTMLFSVVLTFAWGGVQPLLAESPQDTKITVSGVVSDADGPIIGAGIGEKGTSNGTSTNVDGYYTLRVSPNATLEISYLGYTTQSIAVNGKTTINIILLEDAKALEEVVVVGYGVQKKSDVTGALTHVGAKEIEARPVTNVMQALQGKAAGVDITSNERPGELGTVRIRGERSITAKSDPLYVLDGIPLLSASAIETINPRDIESVDILKDASATAIYGSRGANGVILVTTKRGKAGSFKLNYSGTLTTETQKTKSKMMNASDYITWRRWAMYNAGNITSPGDQPTQADDAKVFSIMSGDPTAYNNIMSGWVNGQWDGSRVESTDWTDFVTRTGITTEHTLSASGGTEKSNTYASFGYLNNKGTLMGQSYDRYTGNINTTINPTQWFTLGAAINASYGLQEYGTSQTGSSLTSGVPTYIYGWAQRNFAFAKPYDADGNFIQHPGGEDNVANVVDEWNRSQAQRKTFRAFGSFYGVLNIGEIVKPLDGLKFRVNFGPDFRYRREGTFISAESVTRGNGAQNYTRLQQRNDLSWTLDEQIDYNRLFGKHSLGATLLHTASKWAYETSDMNGQGVPSEDWTWNAFSTLDPKGSLVSAGWGTGLDERQLESYMMRFNYGFNDRYLLTVSGRWDGASQLAAGHHWDFFPAAALGWRINQEDFMQDYDWVSNLKLRAGVGTTGSSAVNPYGTLGAIQSGRQPFNGINSDGNLLVYTTNEPFYTSTQVGMPNKQLGWEKTTQWNVGLDFGFLNGRINGVVDVYTSSTKDLLLKMDIPTLLGYPNTTANIGRTSNKGVDITLDLIPVKTRDFSWNSTLSAAYTKNKIEELTSGKADDALNSWFIGSSISAYYNFKKDRLWQDTPEDLELMAKYNANGHKFKPGLVKPVDVKNDLDKDGKEIYKIDENDRVILGNRDPRWTFGWMNTFNYKNLELSLQVYGRFKYWVEQGGESQTGRYNQRQIDYWTPTNTGAEYQMPVYNEAGGDAYANTLGFRQANFLKMRNISLGYILPQNIIRKAGISNLKVYVQANNPFTIYSSVKFIDLDLGSATYNQGWTFGLDVTF